MTYNELKQKIRDLGFEEDATMSEYSSNVINACNRAISTIYHTVLSRIESYFKFKDSEWVMPEMDVLYTDTPGDYVLNLPDKIVFLLPLLSAYYIWLDDDERKAITYRNEYEDLKEQIFAECLGGTRCRVVGGLYV